MQNSIKSFSIHPSILKIKDKFKLNKKFSSQSVSEATVKKVVKSFPSDKARAGKIPINVLKNSEICFFDLTNCINEAIRNKNLVYKKQCMKNLTLVIKPIIDQSVFYNYYQKYLKKLFMTSFMDI